MYNWIVGIGNDSSDVLTEMIHKKNKRNYYINIGILLDLRDINDLRSEYG